MTTALECVQDIQAKIQTLAALNQNTFFVYTQEDMMKRTAKIVFPAAGIIYEGIRSKPDIMDKGTSMGLSADFHCAVLILVTGSSFGNVDYKAEAIKLVDSVRGTILKTRSPSGNFWKFLVESPVVDVEGAFGYYIRFSTPILLS